MPEWKHLVKILELYGKAFNAKVNLNKTAVVSLSGYPHSSWKTLLQPLEIKWHDEQGKEGNSSIGIPMYSSWFQLQDFVDGLEMKIKRHIDMLEGRHLSIREEVFCLRTGHDTILPVIMFPKEYKHCFKIIATLKRLTILIKLPPLTPHPPWSTEWIMNCPLIRTLPNGMPGERCTHHPNLIHHLECV